jgi:ADP-glucose pyrophosphorylase
VSVKAREVKSQTAIMALLKMGDLRTYEPFGVMSADVDKNVQNFQEKSAKRSNLIELLGYTTAGVPVKTTKFN